LQGEIICEKRIKTRRSYKEILLEPEFPRNAIQRGTGNGLNTKEKKVQRRENKAN